MGRGSARCKAHLSGPLHGTYFTSEDRNRQEPATNLDTMQGMTARVITVKTKRRHVCTHLADFVIHGHNNMGSSRILQLCKPAEKSTETAHLMRKKAPILSSARSAETEKAHLRKETGRVQRRRRIRHRRYDSHKGKGNRIWLCKLRRRIQTEIAFRIAIRKRSNKHAALDGLSGPEPHTRMD